MRTSIRLRLERLEEALYPDLGGTIYALWQVGVKIPQVDHSIPFKPPTGRGEILLVTPTKPDAAQRVARAAAEGVKVTIHALGIDLDEL